MPLARNLAQKVSRGVPGGGGEGGWSTPWSRVF